MIEMIHLSSLKLTASLICAAFCFCTLADAEAPDHPPTKATVPLIIDQGRPMVEITLEGPDGTRESARFLADTGGGAFILPESLAVAVGLQWSETFFGEGREFARPDTLPVALLGELALPLMPERVLVAIDGKRPGPEATGLLPGHILAQHHVIFDYPERTLTLAAPGSIEPVGTATSMPVSRPMGFPRTEIEVAGETWGMLLDTGPPATILSEAVMQTWSEAKPEWSYLKGAHAEAEILQRIGGQALGTMTVGELKWAGVTLNNVTMAAQREGVFETYMSRMMTAPVVGALGSNAFMEFRLELDYQNETLYVSRTPNRNNGSARIAQ